MTETNTSRSFADKWRLNPDFALKQILDETSDTFQWILNRNGFTKPEDFRQFLWTKKRILDAGCGNGRVTLLLRAYSAEDTPIVGFDFASADVGRQNMAAYPNVTIYQKDLLGNLSELGQFDFIYCQEVLHHTTNPALGFDNLCSLLEPGGEIAIYVYKQKAPVREFVDDHIRQKIAGLSYEEALKVSEQITELGKTLSELNLKVKIPAVDVLEIQAGEYDLQRFIYHFFMKCFWDPAYSFHENAVVNYDWYHPQLSSRHTPEEVKQWFENNDLEIIHTCVDFYGITMRGIKPKT